MYTNEMYWKATLKMCGLSSPSDRVCIDYKTDDKLYEIWKNRAVIEEEEVLKSLNFGGYNKSKAYGVPSDIIFADTIPLKDFEIWCDERGADLKDGYSGHIVKYRVVIYEKAQKLIAYMKELLKKGQIPGLPPIEVGCMIVDLYGSPCKMYIPIFVQDGSNFLGMMENSVFVKFPNGELKSPLDVGAAVSYSDLAMFANELSLTWYSIQISLLHPQIKNLYKVDDPREKNLKKKKSKQTKRHTKLIRKVYLNEDDIENVINPKKNVNWKTLVWYVCGHFRHYKNGNTIFIQPYWKGALREVKRNLDEGRDRELAIGGLNA